MDLVAVAEVLRPSRGAGLHDLHSRQTLWGTDHLREGRRGRSGKALESCVGTSQVPKVVVWQTNQC